MEGIEKSRIERRSRVVGGMTGNGAQEGELARRGQADPEIGRLWCQANVRPSLDSDPHIISHLQSFAASAEADSYALRETYKSLARGHSLLANGK